MPIVITPEARERTNNMLELFIREMKSYLDSNPSTVNFPAGRAPCRNGHLRIKRAPRRAAPGLSILVLDNEIWRSVVRVDATISRASLTIFWPCARHVLELLCREETRVKLQLGDTSERGGGRGGRFLTVCKSADAEVAALAGMLTGALCATGGFRK